MADEESKRIDLFFTLLEWLKQTDNIPDEEIETWLHKNPDLDYKQKQLAYDDKQKTIDFFETVIDQPAFSTDDHKRLRKFVIDWYASHRTFVTQMFKGTDPFSMSSESLNEMILSFGFPYPHTIVSSTRKAQFLLDLLNMYHKKGTPATLVRALQTYFGLSNVILSEWWINRRTNGEFYAVSEPIYPIGLQGNANFRTEVGYDSFASSDPLWQITEADLIEMYNNAKIKLPSITSHISLQATVSVFGVNAALAILNRKIQESYEYWLEVGELNKNIPLSKYSWNISALELTLLIDYVFNSSNDTTDERFLFYEGRHKPFDIPEEDGSRDDIDDIEFGLIIDEYNEIVKKPATRLERNQLLELKKEKFTAKLVDKSIVGILRDSGTILNNINPSLKEEFDLLISSGADTREVVGSLLLDLEYYLMENLEVMEYPISYLITGVPLEKRLKDVMDFFKPYRARIREFISSMSFDDVLDDSQRVDDTLDIELELQFVDKGYLSDLTFEQCMVEDRLFLYMNMDFSEYLLEIGALKDYFFTNINHTMSSLVELEESKIITIDQWFAEQNYDKFDFGMVEDAKRFTITQKLGSILDVTDSTASGDEFYEFLFTSIKHRLIDTYPEITDNHRLSIYQNNLEYGPWNLDIGMIKDRFINTIKNSLFSNCTFFLKDELEHKIFQSKISYFNPSDFNMIKIGNLFLEKGSFGFDYGLSKDKLLIEQKSNITDYVRWFIIQYLHTNISHKMYSNIDVQDIIVPKINNNIIEYSPFGFDHGRVKDLNLYTFDYNFGEIEKRYLFIGFDSTSDEPIWDNNFLNLIDYQGIIPISSRISDNIIKDDSRIYTIDQQFVEDNKLNWWEDGCCYDRIIPAPNILIRDRAFRKEFDESGWDYIFNKISQDLKDEYNFIEKPNIGTHMLFIEPSNRNFLDMSHIEDSVEIEVIDL